MQCLQDGRVVVAPNITWLQDVHEVTVAGEFLPFIASSEGKLEWTGRWGKTLHFKSTDICFVNLSIKTNGRWELSVEEENVFINNTGGIDTCPQFHATPYQGVDHTSLRPPLDVRNCLFCDVALSVQKMLDHVAGHWQRGRCRPLWGL